MAIFKGWGWKSLHNPGEGDSLDHYPVKIDPAMELDTAQQYK